MGFKQLFGKILGGETTKKSGKPHPEKKVQQDGAREVKKQKPQEKEAKGPDKPFGGRIASVTNAGIEYYWKKIEIATGYEVYRAYEIDGSYELIYTAPKRNIGTYIDGDFDHGKKRVYYKVRSFLKKPDDTYMYSAFSDVTEAVFQEELSLSRANTYMFAGIQRSLHALHGWGEPADGIWSSDDPSVATVDANGLITGVGKGECRIIYRSESLGKQATARVVVERDAEPALGPVENRYRFDHQDAVWKQKQSGQKNDAVIMMVGDMMCSSVQMRNQYSDKQGWNFNDSFVYTREVMAESDFAVGNLETLLAPGWPYMIDEAYIDNYNNCNAPSRYLDAVHYGGFDAVMMANNHNCDGGTRALMQTIEQVDRYGFIRTGVFTDDSEKHYFIVEINGIKVGFLAYMTKATGFNYKEESWTEEERETHLNIFSLEKAKRDIAQARAAGAEYVIVYMHWGMKNFFNLTKGQMKDAQAIADAGADFVVGANPHVLQKYEVLTSCDGKIVPCYYSTGNYQSVMKQVEENRDSIVVRVVLKRDETGSVVLAENDYIPCYTYRHAGASNWAPVALSERYNKSVLKQNKMLKRIRNAIGEDASCL